MEIRTAIYNYTIFMKILKIKKFKLVKQLEGFDCGLACLCMITKYYGRNCSLRTLNNENKIGFGININKLIDVAESLGLRTLGVQIPFEKLATKVNLPCIAYIKKSHYIVVYKIKKDDIYIADPFRGLMKYSKEKFLESWKSCQNSDKKQGICILFEPSSEFYRKRN